MTKEQFNKTEFCPGMGFRLQDGGFIRLLATCDFENGECEDDEGNLFELDRIHSFVHLDGTSVTMRP